MKIVEYKFDQTRFQKMAMNYIHKLEGWKSKKWMVVFTCAVAVFATIAPIMAQIFLREDGSVPGMFEIALTIVACLMLGTVTGSIAFTANRIVKLSIGRPYYCMRNVSLYTTYNGLCFEYHDRFDREHPGNFVAEQIAFSNIRNVIVQKDFIKVVGRIELVKYMDRVTRHPLESFTNGQFGDSASFIFFRCFENEEAFLRELYDHNVPVIFGQ